LLLLLLLSCPLLFRRFAATEAKWLRVSVTSFYDYLIVALKCYQEFDTCDNDNSDNP